MLGVLVSRKRVLHALVGVALGVILGTGSLQWSMIPAGSHVVQGRVVSSGFTQGNYRAVLDDVTVDGENLRGKARISIYRHVSDLSAGSRIRSEIAVQTHTGFGNRDEFDYIEYLLNEGITLRGAIRDFGSISILEEGCSRSLKQSFTRKLSQMSRPEAEVIKAVLTGDRSGLTPSIRDAFISLGIAHLLAISGLHMGIIIMLGYGISLTLLRFIVPVSLRTDSVRISHFVGLGCAVFYTLFVGAPVTTVRATIMAGTVLGSLLLIRKACILEGLTLAGMIILVLWPRSLYSAGFLLSFSAVLGISGVLMNLKQGPWWIKLLAITFVVNVFTLPVVSYLFGYVSFMGFIFNLIIVPFFSFLIMPLGIAGLLLFPVSETLSSLFLGYVVSGISLIFYLSGIFGSYAPIPKPPLMWVFLCYLGFIIALFSRQSSLRSAILILICIGVVIMPFHRELSRTWEPLTFDFLSVGHGDCTLLTRGTSAVLIDGGGMYSGFDTGRYIVAHHLLRRGITRLDLIVISHSHKDHIGGIPFLVKHFNVKEIWVNIEDDWNSDFQAILATARKKSIPVRSVCSGDGTNINGMSIKVLNPSVLLSSRTEKTDLDSNSIVVLASDETMRGLFMADAHGRIEQALSHSDDDISAHVLKVSHHGSKQSCSDLFLDTVHPDVAVISCGYKNRYHEPNEATISRLEKRGIRVYRTDIHGEITVSSTRSGPVVKSVR